MQLRKTGIAFFAAVTASSIAVPAALAQPQIRTEHVQFAEGKSVATIKGSVKGDQTVDYILTVTAGQQTDVLLKTASASAYFNITASGEDSALFIGSTSGNHFKGSLPKAGEYTVRLYLMRNAARRGQKADYTITFTLVQPGSTPAVKATAGAAK
jgi:hypothetical protein